MTKTYAQGILEAERIWTKMLADKYRKEGSADATKKCLKKELEFLKIIFEMLPSYEGNLVKRKVYERIKAIEEELK